MKNFVVVDSQGKRQIVGAQGFIPDGAICEAPADAGPDDGDCISIVNGSAVLDQSAKQAKVAAIAQAKANEQTKAELKKSIRDSLLALKKGDIKNANDAEAAILKLIQALL